MINDKILIFGYGSIAIKHKKFLFIIRERIKLKIELINMKIFY